MKILKVTKKENLTFFKKGTGAGNGIRTSRKGDLPVAAHSALITNLIKLQGTSKRTNIPCTSDPQES